MRKIWGIKWVLRLMATFWVIYARPNSDRKAKVNLATWLVLTLIALLPMGLSVIAGRWNWPMFVFVSIPTIIFDVVILKWCFEGLAYRRWCREQSEEAEKIKAFLLILERNAADDRPEDS
jgi:hypothetical protein